MELPSMWPFLCHGGIFFLVSPRTVNRLTSRLGEIFLFSFLIWLFTSISYLFPFAILATFKLCRKDNFKLVRLFPPFYFTQDESMSTVLPFTFFLCLSLGDYVTSEFYTFFGSLLCGLNTIHSSIGFDIRKYHLPCTTHLFY